MSFPPEVEVPESHRVVTLMEYTPVVDVRWRSICLRHVETGRGVVPLYRGWRIPTKQTTTTSAAGESPRLEFSHRKGGGTEWGSLKSFQKRTIIVLWR